MSTITDGTTTVEPLLVLNADRSRSTRNAVLEPIDSPEPYVSLAAASTSRQTLRALFADETAAQEGLELVGAGRTLTVTTSSRTFSCVLVGDVTIDRASEARQRWILEAEIRELA